MKYQHLINDERDDENIQSAISRSVVAMSENHSSFQTVQSQDQNSIHHVRNDPHLTHIMNPDDVRSGRIAAATVAAVPSNTAIRTVLNNGANEGLS